MSTPSRGAWEFLKRVVNPSYWTVRIAAAGATALVICGAIWLGVENARLRRDVSQVRDRFAALERDVAEKLRARQGALSFLLEPGLTRREAGRRLLVPVDAHEVQLMLIVSSPTEAPGFRAALATPEGYEVWSGEAPAARITNTGKTVSIIIPAGALAASDYV